MTAVVLGRRDPLDVTEGPVKVCSAVADRVAGLPMGFVCTRAPEHAEPEHVASGPFPAVGPVAIAVWVDGGAPRVIDEVTLRRVLRGELS